MPDAPPPIPIRTALISVSDKAGIAEFARTLHEKGAELLSTGGTAQALRDAGLPVTDVAERTGFPEILGGRVKTLHPAVHAGILARGDDPEHLSTLDDHAIGVIDLVCVSLYPFERTIAREGVTHDEAVEQIDIGGPAMIRAAAKNADRVTVVTDPGQYDAVRTDLDETGGVRLSTRRSLAARAFARTSAYDAAIAAHLESALSASDQPMPETVSTSYRKVLDLRYGENPHQRAALYADVGRAPSGLAGAEQHSGKPLSYNNLLDASAALSLARALHRLDPAKASAVIVKHTNPCGASTAPDPASAVLGALLGDPTASFGGILALGSSLSTDAADAIVREASFIEVVLAPRVDPEAAAALRDRWTNCRVLETGAIADDPGRSVRQIPGGAIVQDPDAIVPDPSSWTHHAGPEVDARSLHAGAMLTACVRALSSNAIAIGGPDPGGTGLRLFGVGSGQVDRVTACRLAVEKARDAIAASAGPVVASSDAFFPFPDGPEILIDAGVGVLVQPGGSKRDAETHELCNARGVTCLHTGFRHFRH